MRIELALLIRSGGRIWVFIFLIDILDKALAAQQMGDNY